MADHRVTAPALVDQLLERIAAAVHADRATLSRIDGDSVVIEGGFDADGASIMRGSRWQITAPEFQRLVVDAEPSLHTYDPATLPSPFREQLGGVRHTATVPVVLDGKVVGAIAAHRRRDRPFDSSDLTALRDLGNIAVLALENSMLRDQAQQADSQARSSEQRFRLLVESVKDYAIFMLDPAGRVISWNRGAERIKGYRAEEIVGRHFSIFYRPEDAAAGEPARGLAAALKEGRFEAEGWRLRKDGTPFWANVVITALRDSAGRLQGYAKVTRDITERKRIQDQLLDAERREAARFRELAEQLAGLERAKSEFLKLASHELRTPVSLLQGYLSLFEEGDLGALNAVGKRAVEVMRTQAGELTFLIEQMLEAARLEQGTVTLQLEVVDLREVASQAVDWVRRLARADHEVALLIPNHPVHAVVDRRRMSTVLRSLLDNAVKYSPEGGKIVCEVRDEAGWAKVNVLDQGLGIQSEQREQLFRPFGRVVTTDTADIGGAGLDLYLARELSRLQGGDLAAKSDQERGSVFTLSLPLAPIEAPIPKAVTP
ncbi:MAG TPA: PAS domain S-box protein [Candidatus Angelobacter sp.]|nr:PAS domain S-box protein [Candidatus Angelobacter sp.]